MKGMIGQKQEIIIYGEILHIQMKQDNDHVQMDGMYLVWRNGVMLYHIGKIDHEIEV
jgi:hypothetical protein